MNRFFLLSPARADGRRAQLLARPQANFELARRLQIGDASIGEVFAFCSGLYFRGKLAYAHRFAQATLAIPGVLIITPSRGLLPAETRIGLKDLHEFSAVPVDAAETRFTVPLQATAAALPLEPPLEVVLLGSVATGKYVEPLLPFFGERLLFPAEFVSCGDMSRGALMLRCVASGMELDYLPVRGTLRSRAKPLASLI
ncbi:MAG: hypothetical protein P4L99_19925 [Chthoniobacter sp.]|nr:hypothetical protein [Chthoniobacter sp.]